MATAQRRNARLAKALIMLAPIVSSALLMCACPAREAASGQDATTTATQLATDNKTEGVSLWYEFVVSEIGFMLDENGELPQSLDDWKRKAEDVGGRAVTTIHLANDEGQLITERLPENQIQLEYELAPFVDIYFFSDFTEWSCLSYRLGLHSLPSRYSFSPGYINSLTEVAQGDIKEYSDVIGDGVEFHAWYTYFRERDIGYRFRRIAEEH